MITGGNFKQGQHLLWMLQETDAAQLVVGNLLGVAVWLGSKDSVGTEARFQQVAYHFWSLCHKQIFTLTVLFQFQRTNQLDLVLAKHIFLILFAKIGNIS